MSQQRFRFKNRDTSQMTLRKSNAAVKESVNNHLFEETFCLRKWRNGDEKYEMAESVGAGDDDVASDDG